MKRVETDLLGPFGEEPSVGRARAHVAHVASGRSLSSRAVGFVHVAAVKAHTGHASVPHTFAAIR